MGPFKSINRVVHKAADKIMMFIVGSDHTYIYNVSWVPPPAPPQPPFPLRPLSSEGSEATSIPPPPWALLRDCFTSTKPGWIQALYPFYSTSPPPRRLDALLTHQKHGGKFLRRFGKGACRSPIGPLPRRSPPRRAAGGSPHRPHGPQVRRFRPCPHHRVGRCCPRPGLGVFFLHLPVAGFSFP